MHCSHALSVRMLGVLSLTIAKGNANNKVVMGCSVSSGASARLCTEFSFMLTTLLVYVFDLYGSPIQK